MTYRVVFTGGAAAQYYELPVNAQDFLVARLIELAEAPWDAIVLLPGMIPVSVRRHSANGLGLVGVHVSDVDETLRIFNLVWIG